jgi:branched-chain amino acid transport system substrate-binding protein
MRVRVMVCMSAAICLTCLPSAAAEKQYGPGVSDTEIKIGEVMPYSGPAAAFGVIGLAEAAYFKMVNEQGGVNGRRIAFLSLDSAYSPPKALEGVRQLVERDRVFAMVGSLGTPVNVATQRYLTDAKVPNLFIRSGASRFNDPEHFPWTISAGPLYRTEARIYGKFILAAKPGAKIAVLLQHDDYGRDYLAGLRDGLGARADAMIVATATYETSDPTVDSQMIALQASGADTLLYIATPKFAALAIRKVGGLGWKPLQIVNFPAATVTIMTAAGTAAATGAITAFSAATDPSDPTRANDPTMQTYRAFMKRYYPGGDPTNAFALNGYSIAILVAEVLRRCGDELTREHLIDVATHLQGVTLPFLVPGTSMTYTPTDYDALKQFQLYRFDGTRFVPFGGLVNR